MPDERGPLDFEDREGVAGADQREPRVTDPPSGPTPARSESWSRVPLGIALLALVVLIAWVGLNTANTTGIPTTGLARGKVVPPFAAPLAASRVGGDVNVASKRGQGAAGKVPACSVRGPGILNSCDLLRGHPAVLAFFTIGQDRCLRQLDTLQRVRARHPRIAFAAIALGGDRDRLRALLADRRYAFPVAYDRDSVLANIFGIAVCPLVTFVDERGRVAATGVGEQSPTDLERRLAALEAGASGA